MIRMGTIGTSSARDWSRPMRLRTSSPVIRDRGKQARSSGLPFIAGTTSSGLRLAVVFTIVPDPDYVLIRPVTAYPLED